MSSGRPRASSRAVISEAACELFLERGFHATSIGDIASRAGVSRSSFFNYFESKDAILWASLDERIDRLIARPAASRPPDALAELADGFQPDSLALAIMNADAMGMREELDRASAWRQARIARAVSDGLVAAGRDPLVAAVAGGAHAAAVLTAIEQWAASGPGRTPLADSLVRALRIAAITLG